MCNQMDSSTERTKEKIEKVESLDIDGVDNQDSLSATSRRSPLTYIDHFNATEDDIGSLVQKRDGNQDDDGSDGNIDQDLEIGKSGDDEKLLEEESKDLKSKQTNKRKMTSGPRGGVYEPFPLKLHRMLATVEEVGLTNAVAWKPHGRAFQVKHVHQFVQNILPKFFRQTKLTSFQRQLNLYGFRRIVHGPDTGAYYHELFLRGKPFLCRAMVRTKVKGKSRLRASDLVGTEPDLYTMPHLPILTTDDYDTSKNALLGNGFDQMGKESEVSNSRKKRKSTEHGTFQPLGFFPNAGNYNDPEAFRPWSTSIESGIREPSMGAHSMENSFMPAAPQNQHVAPSQVPSWSIGFPQTNMMMPHSEYNNFMMQGGVPPNNLKMPTNPTYSGGMYDTLHSSHHTPRSSHSASHVPQAHFSTVAGPPQQSNQHWQYNHYSQPTMDYNPVQQPNQRVYPINHYPSPTRVNSSHVRNYNSSTPTQVQSARAFQNTISPMQMNQNITSEQEHEAIELPVDGEMKELLKSIFSKKDM